jgi:hypothetical protein
MRRLPLPVFAERSFQAPIHFHRDVRLQADMFGQVVIGIVCGRSALLVKFAIKLVATSRQRVEPRDAFEVDEVVGLLRVLEGKLRRAAPAVGLRSKVGDLDHGAAQEARHGGRNFLRSDAVDGSMPLVPPRERSLALNKNEGDQRQADQPSLEPFGRQSTPNAGPLLCAPHQNAKCSESCRKRGLPIVCWITPKLPCGGICGGPAKLGKKVTSLFGASKSGWLKILKASASNFSR